MPSGVGFLFGGLDVVNLTPKQEKFAQCVADGMTQADAYRVAYDCAPTTKPETIQNKAHELMKNGEVAARVKELRDQLAELALWTRRDSVETLKSIANDEMNAKPAERVSAVKELNAMHGWNNKQIIDHTSSDGSMRPSPTRIELVAPSVKHDDDAD